MDTEGIGREMERAAERMGGTTKWPYNDSDCLNAEQFKLVADNLISEFVSDHSYRGYFTLAYPLTCTPAHLLTYQHLRCV